MENISDYIHPYAICSSISMNEVPEPPSTKIKQLMSKDHDPIITIRLYLRHWREIIRCQDCKVARLMCPEHHITLDKKLQDMDLYKCDLVIPLDDYTLPYHLSMAFGNVEPLPSYVTPGVWSYLKEKVFNFLVDNVDFHEGLGFKMVVMVDVSTIHVNALLFWEDLNFLRSLGSNSWRLPTTK